MSKGRERDELLEQLRHAGATPEQMAAMTEALGSEPRPRPPGFLVALGTQRIMPGDQNLEAFAKALEIDAYTARQRLSAPTPRILRREETEVKAVEWVEWLGRVKISAFLVPEELLSRQTFLPLAALHREEDLLVATDLMGGRQEVQLSDVACVVMGEVRERISLERTSRDLFGDRVLDRSRDHRQEAFIDIHRRDSAETLRIGQDSFSWSTAFPEEFVHSALHLREFLLRLKQMLPGVPFHQEFDRAEAALGQSLQAVDSSAYLSFNWKWVTIAARARLEEVKTRVESNQAHFDMYSTLLRWEQLRLKTSRAPEATG